MSRRIPPACLLADLRRVLAQTGCLNVRIYRELGNYASITIIRGYGSWSRAVAAARGDRHPVVRGHASHEEQSAIEEARVMRRAAKAARRPRRCLRCDKTFLSAGPQNRLCDWCAGQNAGYAVEYVGARD